MEWQFELLLQQADGDVLELKGRSALNARAHAGDGKLVDDALQFEKYGLHVVGAGLDLHLAQLTRAW